jgi:proliferating cell nuclear antigen
MKIKARAMMLGWIDMTFNIKTADAKRLKDTFAAFAALIDEGTFNLSADGILLRAMDPSRVAMVDFAWTKSAFEEYTCYEPAKLSVNIAEILKLLRRTAKEDSVQLTLEEKTGRLQVIIRGKYMRTFNMPTLQATEEEFPVPKVTFNSKAKMTTDGLRQALEDAALVSDHVKIEMDQEKLMLNATRDIMDATIELQKGSESVLELETKEPAKATFSLSYLSKIINATTAISDIVTIELSTDMPLRLDFNQPKDGKLAYYLAPRIETE